MKNSLLHLSFVVFSLVALVLFYDSKGTSSLITELVSTPSLLPTRSLFEEDTCAPPCWFGLTPGESTIQDIIGMFRGNADLFILNPVMRDGFMTQNFKPLIEGNSAFFLWQTWMRDDDLLLEGYMEINDGSLDWMRIAMNRNVPLSQTLAVFGVPERVSASGSLYILYLTLFYPELRIVVVWVTNRVNHDMSQLSQDFKVDYLLYYSPGLLEFLAEDFNLYLYDVPDEVWDSWLNGELEGSYDDVIGKFVFAMAAATQIPK